MLCMNYEWWWCERLTTVDFRICSSEFCMDRKINRFKDWSRRRASWQEWGFHQIESTVHRAICKSITFWKWIYAYLHSEHERVAHESKECRKFEQCSLSSIKHKKSQTRKQDIKEGVKSFTHLLLGWSLSRSPWPLQGRRTSKTWPISLLPESPRV